MRVTTRIKPSKRILAVKLHDEFKKLKKSRMKINMTVVKKTDDGGGFTFLCFYFCGCVLHILFVLESNMKI